MSSNDILIISKQMDLMSMSSHSLRVSRRNKTLQQYRYSPYTLRTRKKDKEMDMDMEKEMEIEKEKMRGKQKEEAVRLGVELSIYLAEAMFLLSDHKCSMFRFCFWLFTNKGKGKFDGPVVGRVFRVIQYVCETHLKPKTGVYQNDDRSIQYEQVKRCTYHFGFGIRVLANIVSFLENGILVKRSNFQQYRQERKMLEDKLRSVRNISKANGFAREVVESTFIQLWKSLFETTPAKLLNPDWKERFALFRYLWTEATQDDCSRRLASLLI